MKLRTKIILISSTVILLALLASNLIIYKLCRDSMTEEATHAAYIESNEVKNEFERFSSQLNGNVGPVETEYFFKANRDDYTVCLRNEETYYNNTVLTKEELISGEYENYLDLPYKEYRAAGREILIFKAAGPSGTTCIPRG